MIDNNTILAVVAITAAIAFMSIGLVPFALILGIVGFIIGIKSLTRTK